MADPIPDTWMTGEAYDRYIGRWSRRIAPAFLDLLAAPRDVRWVDVGCGTGALTGAIIDRCRPISVVAVDPSPGFLETARGLVPDATFVVGDASDLPLPDASVQVAVSGLVLNFVTDPTLAVREMARVLARGGLLGAYVWDYADGMEITRRFWEAAIAVDPAAAERDEGGRFGLCHADALQGTVEVAIGAAARVAPLEVAARFDDFDDYWMPFLGGQGAAPSYLATLPESQQDAIRDRLRADLPFDAAEPFTLRARAWAVTARV